MMIGAGHWFGLRLGLGWDICPKCLRGLLYVGFFGEKMADPPASLSRNCYGTDTDSLDLYEGHGRRINRFVPLQ